MIKSKPSHNKGERLPIVSNEFYESLLTTLLDTSLLLKGIEFQCKYARLLLIFFQMDMFVKCGPFYCDNQAFSKSGSVMMTIHPLWIKLNISQYFAIICFLNMD